VNYTSQAVTTDDSGYPADAQWLGAGLVNAGASVTATVTAEPATVSFGFLNSAKLPITQSIKLTNIGSSAVTLTAVVSCCTVNGSPGGSLSNATLAVSPTSGIALAAGASSTLTVTLSGSAPPASEYSGTINLQQGSTVVARIPFMMIEGDLVPYNLSVVAVGSEGPPNTDLGPNYIQVTDQYGVPVANTPVTFSISPRGGVTLQSVAGEPTCTSSATAVTCNTDQYGFAYAEVISGATPRQVTLSSTVAGNPVSGTVNIQVPPTITGASDAAAGLTTVAPGSYIAIYGTGLSNYTDANSTVININSTPTTEATDPVVANGAVLPLQIDYVTVSFDVQSAGISVPGHLTYVSPTQVNVQVPWELQGYTSVQMKVTLDSDLFGNVYTLKLANTVPAFFSVSGTAIGTDLSANLITTSNPAKRGNVIVMYANGLGPVTNQPASGNPAGVPLSATTTVPVVMIGGQQATVGYSGLVPGLPGLYQLNVTVPSGISTGAQTITVAIGGATSPNLTIPVQ
jgi:minor extracellular serine protease Vpr